MWRKNYWVLLLSSFLFTCAPSPVPAAGYWWEGRDQGWFFYNEKPVEPERKPEEPKKEKPLEDPRPAPPALPFAKAMKEKGEALLSTALGNPSVENVKAYMEHNKLSIQISQDFAVVWKKVLMQYPDLASKTPVSDSDKGLYFASVREEERKTLYALSQRAGLFFVYSSTCPYCQRQAEYLDMFRKEYPFFTIKAVSIDGVALPEFPDTVPDNGIAQTLGVDTVPAIFVAFPPDRFDRITTGLMTVEELKGRLILYDQKIDVDYSNLGASR